MKIYILTDCTSEGNYTPVAFKTRKEAQETMKQLYKRYVENDAEAIAEKRIYGNYAEIVYVDDTYNKLEIFEVDLAD